MNYEEGSFVKGVDEYVQGWEPGRGRVEEYTVLSTVMDGIRYDTR